MGTAHHHITKKFGGGSVFIWGSMSALGPGNMCRIFFNMTGPVYTEILERLLMPSTAWLLPHRRDHFTLQHDNDPKHTSRVACTWLEAHCVATLAWPSQSPDLNLSISGPSSSVAWARARNLAQSTSSGSAWGPTWWAVEPSLCLRLVKSMKPARIDAMIRAKCGYMRF